MTINRGIEINKEHFTTSPSLKIAFLIDNIFIDDSRKFIPSLDHTFFSCILSVVCIRAPSIIYFDSLQENIWIESGRVPAFSV